MPLKRPAHLPRLPNRPWRRVREALDNTVRTAEGELMSARKAAKAAAAAVGDLLRTTGGNPNPPVKEDPSGSSEQTSEGTGPHKRRVPDIQPRGLVTPRGPRAFRFGARYLVTAGAGTGGRGSVARFKKRMAQAVSSTSLASYSFVPSVPVDQRPPAFCMSSR